MKATDDLPILEDGETISFSVSHADLDLWLKETMPVILIIYDAPGDAAYWVYIQAYFERQANFALEMAGETTTVRLRKTNRVNEAAIQQFARFKARVLNQTQGVVHHDDENSALC